MLTPFQLTVDLTRENYRDSCKGWRLRFAHIIVLIFWFMVLFNLKAVGEGHDFCFDGSKEGTSLIN